MNDIQSESPDASAPLTPGVYRVDHPAGDTDVALVNPSGALGEQRAEGPWIDQLETELLPASSREAFGVRWNDVQAGFVDEPRNAVAQADHLVDETIGLIQDSFAQRRAKLEQQWETGNDVSTEDLRLTLQKYRSFFQRLLSL
jgi:hypothetical protein